MKADGQHALREAIVRTVAYVDVFDYPLRTEEVHRYLTGMAAPVHEVEVLLQNGALVPERLARHEEYITLPGREAIVAVRRRREERARRMWPRAVAYGRQIGALPYVRMVAVTGSLAVDNVEAEADIDYLVVTKPGRLWVCRALTILVVRLAARQGYHLCPNYFLSERAMVFDERNLYTAHELVQMAPITGMEIYRDLRRANGWTEQFLPNAGTAPLRIGGVVTAESRRWLGRAGEVLLDNRLGSRLEQWEMKRKIARFSEGERAEAAFSAEYCKGHFDGHAHRIMEQYESRVGADSAQPGMTEEWYD